MRYKSDNIDKAQQQAAPEYMAVTCGSFNSGLAPANYNSWLPKAQDGMGMGMGTVRPGTMMPGALMPGIPMPAVPMPAGYPAVGSPTPLVPAASGFPSTSPAQGVQGVATVPVLPGSPGQPSPVTLESSLFTPGFLRTQIGKLMRVEFLIGTNGLTDRTGTLIAVGASYILLRLVAGDLNAGNTMMCDIYSIKFVTIVENR